MAFDTFLARPDEGATRKRRRLALLGVGAFHTALAGIAIVHGVWSVEELRPPVLMIPTFVPAPPPKVEGAPERPAPAKRDSGGGGRVRVSARPVVEPAPVPTPTLAPPSEAPVVEPTEEIPGDPTGDGLSGTEGPPGSPSGNGRGLGHGPGGDEGPEIGGGGRMLPPQVAAKQCLDCPRPHLPPAYLRAGGERILLAKICADATGRVTSVKVLRGITPAIDADVVGVVAGWRYAPTRVDGRPVPFCAMTRFVFTAE